MKKPCYVASRDPILHELMDEQETTDMFGPEMIIEYGVMFDEELIERSKRIFLELELLQNDIAKVLKNRG